MVLVGLLLSTAKAHASTCVLSPIVFPRPGETAALNTHVFARSIGVEPDAIELRVSTTNAIVETTTTRIDQGEVWYELTPKKPLLASTRYDVIEHRKPDRHIIGTFKTGTTTDTTPPRWTGTMKAELRVFKTAPSKRGVVTVDMLDHADHITVDGPAVEDDVTSSDSIRYAIWANDDTKPIDFTGPPLHHRAEAKHVPHGATARFTLGSVYLCDAAGFDVDKRRGKKFTIGVRPYDLAGNYGEAKELIVDMTKSVPAH